MVQREALDTLPDAAVTAEKDPLGVEDFATHKLPLEQAPYGYKIFQQKRDGAIKVLLQRVSVTTGL